MRKTRRWCQTSQGKHLLPLLICCWVYYKGTRRTGWISTHSSAIPSWIKRRTSKNLALCQCLHALSQCRRALAAARPPAVTSHLRRCRTCRPCLKTCSRLHLLALPTTFSCLKSLAAAPAARTRPAIQTTLCWCRTSLENSPMTCRREPLAVDHPVSFCCVEGSRSPLQARTLWCPLERRPPQSLCPLRCATTSGSSRTSPAAPAPPSTAHPGLVQCGALTPALWDFQKLPPAPRALLMLPRLWDEDSPLVAHVPTRLLHWWLLFLNSWATAVVDIPTAARDTAAALLVVPLCPHHNCWAPVSRAHPP